MSHKEILSYLNDLFKSLGFNGKGSTWLKSNDEITKVVNLQKSNFGKQYYINYGYIIKSIPLGDLSMHVFTGLSSMDSAENKEIMDLLDLDNSIPDDSRKSNIHTYIMKFLIPQFNNINSESDLGKYINESNRPDIPLIVKEYFSSI